MFARAMLKICSIRRTIRVNQLSSVWESVKKRFNSKGAAIQKDLSSEAEESSLLEAVTRGTAGEDTAGWKRPGMCCVEL
jgi:hypothetical protein